MNNTIFFFLRIETFELHYNYPQCLEVYLIQSATEIAIYSLHVYDTFSIYLSKKLS